MCCSQYISGFIDDRIKDYEFSFNTLQKYTHYSFSFPTENPSEYRPGGHEMQEPFKILEYPGGLIDQFR